MCQSRGTMVWPNHVNALDAFGGTPDLRRRSDTDKVCRLHCKLRGFMVPYRDPRTGEVRATRYPGRESVIVYCFVPSPYG